MVDQWIKVVLIRTGQGNRNPSAECQGDSDGGSGDDVQVCSYAHTQHKLTLASTHTNEILTHTLLIQAVTKVVTILHLEAITMEKILVCT